MKAFVSRAVGIDSLAVEDVPRPEPIASGQIRIAMRAASINYRDTAVISGAFGPPGPQGVIPCSDGGGEIVEVAPDVSRVKGGERVPRPFNSGWVGGPDRATAAAMGRSRGA